MFQGIIFQQSLQDLVKGIRAHRRNEEEYIRAKVAEIGAECRGSDVAKKTTGVLKLTHLQMMGHNISFASFYIVEVMSNPEFASKRIGYLAASQSFSPTTDVLLLTTNQFKKDLTNGKLQDCSLALTCLSKLVTEELGRDLEHDVSLLLNSPRPYIRKKSLLVLYRLIMVHPDTLPVVSARFRERLTDSDPSVVCAAVTVTCELARSSPHSFLSLAPVLYQLLTNKDSNNWMLIKIVKLMGVLTPLEPRLGKKLVEPLTILMQTTRAKSLLYECCSTVTSGLMAHPEAVELCAQRLGEFMDENDQNLKYLGLLSMRKLIQAHPHLALEHRDNILDCLDDEDIGIRMRALELVSEFVTKRTLRDISRILLRKLRRASAEGFNVEAMMGQQTSSGVQPQSDTRSPVIDQETPYREALAMELLRAGMYRRGKDAKQSGYEILLTGDDFAWYITSILGGLAEISLLSGKIKTLIGDQLLELTSRVEAVRKISVKVALSLLASKKSQSTASSKPTTIKRDEDNGEVADGIVDENLEQSAETETPIETQTEHVDPKTQGPGIDLSPSLAGSTAWILGEYSELIADHVAAVKVLVSFPIGALDSAAQVRLLMACVKIYSSCSDASAAEISALLASYIDILIDSPFAEVQERSWFFKAILKDADARSRENLAPVFEGKLKPVDVRAQSKIPLPDGLDLEQPLLDTGSESLYTYLLKRIGTGEEEEEINEDEDELFKEAVFSTNTFALPGTGTGIGNEISNRSTLLSSLPSSENKEQSPFYLGANRSPEKLSIGFDEHSADRASRYGYEAGQVSKEAAVVIAEENPLGLDVSDEDRPSGSEKKPQIDERLQAAFDDAFAGNEPGSRSTKKPSKRKKKKKDGKERKGGAGKEKKRQNSENVEKSLIDFDTAPSPPATNMDESSSKPKHLADVLLL